MKTLKLKNLCALMVFFIFSTLLILCAFIVISYQNKNKNSQELWGGIALKAFIYKNSNGKNNQQLTKVAEDILAISERSTTQKDLEIVKMDLVASAVNVSQYGSKDHEEYFAEAFSKWTTATETQKNISWSLIDDFFTIIFPKLKALDLGYLGITNWNLLKNIIETNPAYEKYDLDAKIEKDSLAPKDLGYLDEEDDNLFGYQESLYTFNVFKNILIKRGYNEAPKLNNLIWIIDQNYLVLSKFMNGSLIKTKKTTKERPEKFETFTDLDSYWKETTKDDENKSAFCLKDMTEGLANWEKEKWDETTLENYQEQITNLFNTIFWLCGEDFRYFFINLIITPDFPLKGRSSYTLGFTSVRLDNPEATNNYGYVLIAAEGFKEGETQKQFDASWWSSNNRFVTLHHEMGHILDGFLGQSESENQENKDIFTPWFYKRVANPKTLYKGALFTTNLY